MATNDLTNKYFIKNTLAGTYADFATLFDGLRILRIDGFLTQGQSKNVYTASWEYEDEEDFAIVMQDDSDAPRIIHESTDINITFIIRQKYATNVIDVHKQHKKFIEYMTEKDVWIKNSYNNNLVAHCVCLKEYSPTTEKYQRGGDSWVMGTITLHKLTSKLYHEFALTASLIGCTSDLPPVVTNEKLFATIIPLSGHQQLPWNTKVTMGSVDITSSVYDKATGAVSIASVTGDITIEAEAVMMPSEYEPVEYIRNLGSTTANANYRLDMGVRGTEKTSIYLDFLMSSNGCVLHRMNTSAPSNSNTPWIYLQRNSNQRFVSGWGSEGDTGPAGVIPLDVKHHLAMEKGTFSLNGNVYRESETEGVTFTTATNLCVLWNIIGNFYRCKIKEDDVEVCDHIPCRRLSDGYVGLLDQHDGSVVFKSPSYFIAPHVLTTRHYTGCTASRLSAAITGTAERAVIGSTWSIKITPSSGYTFVGGTTPQVMIDGVDVTSQVVSDNGDGTYNVAIANVEDKPIEITALAVSDGTANATNSVTPLSNNTENNEEEM